MSCGDSKQLLPANFPALSFSSCSSESWSGHSCYLLLAGATRTLSGSTAWRGPCLGSPCCSSSVSAAASGCSGASPTQQRISLLARSTDERGGRERENQSLCYCHLLSGEKESTNRTEVSEGEEKPEMEKHEIDWHRGFVPSRVGDLLGGLSISAGSGVVPGGVYASEQDLSLAKCGWPRHRLGCVGWVEGKTETLYAVSITNQTAGSESPEN